MRHTYQLIPTVERSIKDLTHTNSSHTLVVPKTSTKYYQFNTMATNASAQKYFNMGGTQVKGQFLWFREISSRKFLTLQRYRGKVSLHMRIYTIDDQDYCLIPTKKGAMLDKQQTRDLMATMNDLAAFIGVVSNVNTIYIIQH